MVRYTPNDFLDLYLNQLTQANSKKKGKIEITMKRYDIERESKLPESCDKTGNRPPKDDKSNAGKNAQKSTNNKKKAAKKTQGKAAAKPAAPKTADLPESRSGCIVRAKFNGKKVSCVVPFEEMDEFQRQFGTIFRAHSTSLVPQNGKSERLKKRIAASTQGAKK